MNDFFINKGIRSSWNEFDFYVRVYIKKHVVDIWDESLKQNHANDFKNVIGDDL